MTAENPPRVGPIALYGNWFLDTNEPVISLNYGDSEDAYWIPLDECTSQAAVLNWICHLAEKDRFPSDALGDFVRSLAFVLDMRSHEFGDEDFDPELRAVRTVQSQLTPPEVAKMSSPQEGPVMLGEYWAEYQKVVSAPRPFQWGTRALTLLEKSGKAVDT